MVVTERAIKEPETQPAQGRYLMCSPAYFDVVYRINPWMDPGRPVDRQRALAQWQAVRQQYLAAGHQVVTVEPVEGLPDMVFSANAGLVIDGRVMVARFRGPERAGEQVAYRRWFTEVGLTDVTLATYANEGEGDYLVAGDVILGASGFRTDPRSHDEVAEFFERPVIGLELVDERFYHLDTALAVLRKDLVAYFPAAFAPRSQGVLADLFPDALVATEADAVAFGLNACSDGTTVVIAAGAGALADRFRDRGMVPVLVDTSELQKAGGSTKCCTLELRW